MAENDLPVRRVSIPGAGEPPGATWSNALVIGDEIVISGITARRGDGTIEGGDDLGAQARAVFARLIATVDAAGGHAGNIYKLVIYVTDLERKGELNAARAEVFKPLFPCSTLVGVAGLALPGLLVEVDAFANLRANLRADLHAGSR